MSRQEVAIFGLFWVLPNYIYYTIFKCGRVKKDDKKGYLLASFFSLSKSAKINFLT